MTVDATKQPVVLPRILEYRTVCAGSAPLLADKVNKKIAEGWQPHGGICVDSDPAGDFYQAIVKLAP